MRSHDVDYRNGIDERRSGFAVCSVRPGPRVIAVKRLSSILKVMIVRHRVDALSNWVTGAILDGSEQTTPWLICQHEASDTARTIHGYRSEGFEAEARRGYSQARATQAYPQRYVEENERERPRRARASDAAVGYPWMARAV